MKPTKSILVFALPFFCGLLGPAANQDWRVYPPAFADSRWERVTAPHTVRLEPGNASGMKNFQGVCRRRRHFTADETWGGRKILNEFEGAMRGADVWINVKHLFTHYGGYLPFTVDLTGMVKYVKAGHAIALSLDNSGNPNVPRRTSWISRIRAPLSPCVEPETSRGRQPAKPGRFANPVRAQAGIATASIRSTPRPGNIAVTAEAPGLEIGTATIQSQPFKKNAAPSLEAVRRNE